MNKFILSLILMSLFTGCYEIYLPGDVESYMTACEELEDANNKVINLQEKIIVKLEKKIIEERNSCKGGKK